MCQRDVGKTDLYRPTYSHCVCYTKKGKPGAAFPDVLPVGNKLYENGTPNTASDAVINFIKKQIKRGSSETPFSESEYDVDVFVGQGTIGMSDLRAGLSFLGIDIDPSQCSITNLALRKL